MSCSSIATKNRNPWPRRRLSASLIVLLLIGSGADVAPALATGMGDSNLSIATSSSSLAGGTAKLIVGTLHRQGDKYVGDYRLKVFPYFFKSEKGRLFIRVSESASCCVFLPVASIAPRSKMLKPDSGYGQPRRGRHTPTL